MNVIERAANEQVEADRVWWNRVGELIGATLCGLNYRRSAIFSDPYIEMPGKVAEVLLDQQEKIEKLQKKVDVYSEHEDLLDRTLTALEKQLDKPLKGKGEKKNKHVCGLQGFDPYRDECEGCHEAAVKPTKESETKSICTNCGAESSHPCQIHCHVCGCNVWRVDELAIKPPKEKPK